MEQSFPGVTTARHAMETLLTQNMLLQQGSSETGGGSTSNPVFQIPVVVHVLYNTDAHNITDADIKSGIAALNRDFRRANSDTLLTPLRFRPRAADAQIEFVLARSDPRGRATNGIIRKHTDVSEWKMDDAIKMTSRGGSDAWETGSYLNIWVGPMRNVLGYSSTPGGPVSLDGVVINTTSFGTQSARAPYNMGRTVVHEVGHWLGLKHIWGDTYCGDDGVQDTPVQGNFTSGCPSTFRSSCSNGNDGDMYMNFMDFTDDACMNLFTEGQKQRMRALFYNGGYRAGLLLSKGLSAPSLEEAPLADTTSRKNAPGFKLYPNPAASFILLDFSYNRNWVGEEVILVNAQGAPVKRTAITAGAVRIFIGDLPAGIYVIRAKNGDASISHKFVKL
jgi:hypothetical protein